MDNNFGEIKLEDWIPMEPQKGPPLPRHFEIYWPWYKPPAAEFRVSNLIISPLEVNPGQVVTISVKIINIGSEAGDYTLKLGGDFVAEQLITLEPGESKPISFEVTPDVAKTYQVSVDGLTGSFKATEAPVADIRVTDLAIEPSEGYVGEKVFISVTATNHGTAAGSKRIVCTVS
ncbi:unnamed protein product [marine sediment metagenome]|uniref:CARDB domain-containing protein n=1 Tax=marine sediment metagenome TaxID=412755 RepID=X1NVM7_9ZZZZ